MTLMASPTMFQSEDYNVTMDYFLMRSFWAKHHTEMYHLYAKCIMNGGGD